MTTHVWGQLDLDTPRARSCTDKDHRHTTVCHPSYSVVVTAGGFRRYQCSDCGIEFVDRTERVD